MGVSAALLAVACVGACSDGNQPPPISDTDAAIVNDAGTIVPCSTPAPGCPCAEAGAQVYCGVVYRKSGTHVDCSPGYLTCQGDAGWGSCIGDSIYDGN